MHKEKVFVTGCSGFLGNKLCKRLIKEGHDVAGLIRQHPQPSLAIQQLRGKMQLYEGDLRDYTRIKNIMRGFNPSIIFHLGALTRVSYSFDHIIETMNTNLGGTINMVMSAQEEASNLKKFIFASSVETYGQQSLFMEKEKPMNEATQQHAGSPYGVWKIAGEYFIKQQFYSNKFPGICLRQSNTYGRTNDDYFVVEAFITAMIQNPKVVNFGNPKPIRAFLYVNDLVDLYITLLECNNKEIFGESFTTGPPNGITIGKLADMIVTKLNWKGKINWYTREIRHGEIFYLNTDNEKATKMTGWEPKVSLDEGLDRTIKYWRDKLKCK